LGDKLDKGFTLVEILISITILAILVTIAVPSYIKYKRSAIVSRVQRDLTSCAGELMVQFSYEGITQKDCKVYESNDTCTLEIDKVSGLVKIEQLYCIFNVRGEKIKCEIKTTYGDVNGRIYCYPID